MEVAFMYCHNCNVKLEPEAIYCPLCGRKTSPDESLNIISKMSCVFQTLSKKIHNFFTPIFSSKRGRAVFYTIAGGLILLALIGIFTGNGGYKTVVDKYFEAIEEDDAAALMTLKPQFLIDYDLADDTFTMREQRQMMGEYIDECLEDWDCGENITVRYTIDDAYKPTAEQLDELENVIFDWYAYYVYDREDFNISDARLLQISVSVSGENGSDEYYYPDGFLVIKENGKWKCLFCDVNTSWFSNQ